MCQTFTGKYVQALRDSGLSDSVIVYLFFMMLRPSVMESLASKLMSVAPMEPPTGIVCYLNTIHCPKK